MPTLECLAKRHSGDPGLFIIFSTERALGDLWENLYVQPSWRVPLLDRIDLLPRPHNQETRGQSSQRQSDETLVNWGAIPLHYSYLASEYLWRITGGHPALAQLICANVVREWHERGHRTQVVRLELIRKVVRDLVEDTDLAGFFRYIYQYSIPQPARKTFMRMIKEMRIDSRTLQIQCSELPDADLLQLKDRDIIEKRNGTWFLRLGFYKLWLEKYPPMDSTNA